MSTIFTKIINGGIPSYKIYENDYVYAFLDISPIQEGHTLIVPKIEVGDYKDVPEPYYTEVYRAAKIIGVALQESFKSKRVAQMVLGFGVQDHFHLHLIPINSDKDVMKGQKEASQEQLKSAQEMILQTLNKSD